LDLSASSIITAFWLGILTSISPCPLATNIAAISYVSRQGGQTERGASRILAAGFLYSIGRILAYVLLSFLLLSSVLASPAVSFFLQKYMRLFIGPLLVLVGMVLLDLLTIPMPSISSGTGLKTKLGGAGLLGTLPLGFVFALTFCPVSAALYFGSLIPLAIAARSSLWLPSIFGLGTAIPVISAGIALVLGTKAIGKFFNRVTAADKWIRAVTGWAIIIIGVYLSLKDIFDLF
jgi:cytochrome c-type biogenesis protein